MQSDMRIQTAKQHVDDLIRDADRHRLAVSVRRSHNGAKTRKSTWARRLFDRPAFAR
jgi:Mg-chelatase subunit ChlD